MSEADEHPVLGARRAGAELQLAGLVVSPLVVRPRGLAWASHKQGVTEGEFHDRS
jgi:hypothetical protein